MTEFIFGYFFYLLKGGNRLKRYVKLMLLSIFIVFGVSTSAFYHASPVFADEKTVKDSTPQDDLYKAKYGEYKEKKANYELDALTTDDLEEDSSWIDNIIHPFAKFKGEGEKYFFMAYFSFASGMFKLNLVFTNVLISLLEFGYNSDVILNPMIDKVADSVSKMSGLGSGAFTNAGGLYKQFVGVICAISAFYALYQFVVKREVLGAMSNILKTIVAFAIALIMFSQLSTILKGINTITSSVAVALLPSTVVADNTDDGEKIKITSIRKAMYDNVFSSFVHRPYLMLQYSTTDESKIGSDRVNELLTKKPGSEERKKIAVKEVTEYGNYTLTQKYITERIMFAGIVLFLNGISSIPLFLLAVSLVLCHFWFIIMAVISPFALLWGALPNQFGVIRRFSFELCLPFFIKMGLVLISILLFGLTDIIYNLQSLQNGLLGFALTGLLIAIMFVGLFFFRKRIARIFTLGSEELSKLRDRVAEGKEAVVKPVKNAVQNTTAAAGAVVATAVTGNPAVGMAGMNIGKNVGQALTGDKNIGDAAQSSANSLLTAKRLVDKEANKDLLGNNVSKDFFNHVTDKNMTDNEKEMKDLLMKNGLDENSAKDFLLKMREEGLNDSKPKDLQNVLDKQGENGEMNKDLILSNLKDKQNENSKDYFSRVTDDNITSNEKEIKDYLLENGHDEKSANKTLLNMRKEGLTEMPLDEIRNANENVTGMAIDDNFKRTPQEYLLSSLRDKDKENKYETYQKGQTLPSSDSTVAATTSETVPEQQPVSKKAKVTEKVNDTVVLTNDTPITKKANIVEDVNNDVKLENGETLTKQANVVDEVNNNVTLTHNESISKEANVIDNSDKTQTLKK